MEPNESTLTGQDSVPCLVRLSVSEVLLPSASTFRLAVGITVLGVVEPF